MLYQEGGKSCTIRSDRKETGGKAAGRLQCGCVDPGGMPSGCWPLADLKLPLHHPPPPLIDPAAIGARRAKGPQSSLHCSVARPNAYPLIQFNTRRVKRARVSNRQIWYHVNGLIAAGSLGRRGRPHRSIIVPQPYLLALRHLPLHHCFPTQLDEERSSHSKLIL